MLYKPSLIDKTNTEYLVEVYEDKFNEGVVEDFLNCRSNKRSILKSILVDKNEIIDSNTSRSTLTSKSSVNNLSDFMKSCENIFTGIKNETIKLIPNIK